MNVPNTKVAIDEQLLGFCGRCVIRMYIPNKMDKPGIKFLKTFDALTKYMVNDSAKV